LIILGKCPPKVEKKREGKAACNGH